MDKYTPSLKTLFCIDPTYHGEGKSASFRKKGPGRKPIHGKPGNRLNKQRPLRAYRAVMAYFASKRVVKSKVKNAIVSQIASGLEADNGNSLQDRLQGSGAG